MVRRREDIDLGGLVVGGDGVAILGGVEVVSVVRVWCYRGLPPVNIVVVMAINGK